MEEDLGIIMTSKCCKDGVLRDSRFHQRQDEYEDRINEPLLKKVKLEDSWSKRSFANLNSLVRRTDPHIETSTETDSYQNDTIISSSEANPHDASLSFSQGVSPSETINRRNTELNTMYPHLSNICLSGASTAPSLKDEEDDGDQEMFRDFNAIRVLPIWSCHQQIMESIKKNQVTIIVAETGSGKTTQIPQMLLNHFNEEKKKFKPKYNDDGTICPYRSPVIAITQPRRVAAISLAQRVLTELKLERKIDKLKAPITTQPNHRELKQIHDDSLDVVLGEKISEQQSPSTQNAMHEEDPLFQLGGLVGFSVRFQAKVSRQTQIKFLTDGMILREVMIDPLLRRYRVIVVDEAHERTLRTDILLGILKTLLKQRPSLKVIIMSATLDYRAFKNYFGHGEVVIVPGRQYPVKINHAITAEENYMENLISTIMQLHLSKKDEGDILTFLPGQEEIELARGLLNEKAKEMHNIRSEFARWKGVVEALASLKKKTSWEAFLDGDWYKLQEGKQQHLSDQHENNKRNVDRDNDKASSNPSPLLPSWSELWGKMPSELKILLRTLEPEEVKIARKIRTSLTAIAINMGTFNRSSDSPDSDYNMASAVRKHVLSSSRSLKSLCLEWVDGSHESSLQDGEDCNISNQRVLLEFSLGESGSALLGGFDMENLLDLHILPIYAALPTEQQQLVFQPTPPNCRKIILATNIAETSVTIPGVKYVVDSGFHKVKVYNARNGVETLSLKTVSRAMANQRSGRAGREGPGETYRLYTERSYYAMEINADPEIKRSNLAQAVLELKILGVKDVSHFPFISPPNAQSLEKSLDALTKMGALSPQDGSITELGKKLAALPLDPEFAKLLLDSVELGCTAEILTIVAVFNSDPIFLTLSRRSEGRTSQVASTSSEVSNSRNSESMIELARKKLICVLGDHLTILNAYRMWESTSFKERLQFCKQLGLNHRALLKAKNIRNQLKSVLLSKSIGLTTLSSCLAEQTSVEQNLMGLDAVRRCLVKSFPGKIAHLESRYSTANDEKDYSTAKYMIEATRTPVSLHPSCGLFGLPDKPQYVVFNELIETSKLYMRGVTAINPQWLYEYHPNLVIQQKVPIQSHVQHQQLVGANLLQSSGHNTNHAASAAILAMRTGQPFIMSKSKKQHSTHKHSSSNRHSYHFKNHYRHS